MTTFDRSVPEHWHRVYVEAPIADPVGGFSWWNIQDEQNRDRQRADSEATLNDFILHYAQRNQLQPVKTLAFGFSQGAAILSSLSQKIPDALHGVAFLSGFIFIQDIGPHKMLPKVFIAHGTEDPVVPLAKIEKGIDHLRAHGYDVELVTEKIAHKVGIQGMRSLKDWITKHFAP